MGTTIGGQELPDLSGMLQDVANLKATMPSPASVAPPAVTSNQDVLGSQPTRYAREDHTHPSRVQRGAVSLAATGEATWMFSKSFDAEPNIPNPGYRELADGLPIIIRVKDFYRDGGVLESLGGTGKYTGVLVKGTRLSNSVVPVLQTVVAVQVMTGLTINVAAGGNLAGIKAYLQAAPND